MKIAIALLAFASTASAFAPSTPSFGISTVSRSAPAVVARANGKGDEEEAGLDLDLEEMFDM